MAEHYVEEESRRVAIQMHLEDLKVLRQSQKGKEREGEMSDFQVAMNWYKQELEAAVVLDRDRRLCRIMARVDGNGAAAIQTWAAEEEQARDDGNMARTTSASTYSGNTAGPGLAAKGSKALDAELSLKLEVSSLTRDEIPGSAGESSSTAAARDAAWGVDGERVETKQCISCGDKHVASSLATCPCSHEYCRECLNTLFKQATMDEALFPPRCCQKAIGLEESAEFLASGIVETFKAKELEFKTGNRTYCHRPECSAFVPPQSIRDEVATCVQCSSKTCVLCKGAQHQKDCPKDSGTQELLRLAGEKGWQRCSSCHRLVELNTGCNHITCLCRAEFCYVCGETWKLCDCSWWQEENLLDRATVVAARHAHGQLPAQGIRGVAAALAVNHECDRHLWKRVRGRHECEQCNDVMYDFIFECQRCWILACARCRRNRL